ncbi:nucleoside hydrolase [Dactylosporangium roseum]|nr:nucleoside hydrolase [Dactylosporangium roseum]
MDHDGSLDDLLSLLLLSRYRSVDLLGVAITPADCLIAPAVATTRRILDLTGREHVVAAAGTLTGPNPFPMAWRTDALRVAALPVLNRHTPLTTPTPDSSLPAHQQLADWLRAADRPVTILATGPLTNLAWCLEHHTTLIDAIEELVFMGGAFDVPGNVDEPGHDGSAEWNVYWDPAGAAKVFDSPIPITVFPLDVTNTAPVTDAFVRSFGTHYGNPVSDLAGSLLALSFGTLESTGIEYCCWDSLTTSYLAQPDLFSFDEVRCDIVTTGPSQGRTVACAAGRPVRRAVSADPAGFYQHCVQTLT